MPSTPQTSTPPIRSKDNFLIFGSPQLGSEEIDEVLQCLKSNWIGTGSRVHRFEQMFKEYKSAASTTAVNSCTAALHLSLLAAGLKPGDEVITTPLTFCATVNTIIHAGATPVLADIDPDTMNIDPAEIRKKITSRTRAILPVHFAGRPCDMDALQAICSEFGLLMIEDCAHAIESTYNNQPTGTFGDFGCFSFYVTKNLVTGEGGMVIAKDPEQGRIIKRLALHGMSDDAWSRFSDSGYKHYLVTDCGFKYNMIDLNASLGIHQLNRIEANWVKRRAIWDRYQNAFADLPVTLPSEVPGHMKHAYHLYTILVDEGRTGVSRDQFLSGMIAHNIGVGVHYLSIPEHPYYRDRFGWKAEDFPVARKTGQATVSLPMSPGLSDQDVNDVISAVCDLIS